MKKWCITALYAISALLSAFFAFTFSEHVSFHIAPVIVIIALAMQVVIMLARDGAESTSLSSGSLNKAEVYSLLRIIAYVTLCVIPLLFPVVFFGDERIKSIVSCTAWLFTFIIGFLVFKIMFGKKIKDRIDMETKELQEQIKHEEQGHI